LTTASREDEDADEQDCGRGEPDETRRCETFGKTVRRVMEEHGWDEPQWLETTIEDPGRGQAEAAVSAGADLVLACGGDGTVTACADGLVGTGVPMAIIPMGTCALAALTLAM
jgi:diacylglycerol kinase family enzyme